MRLDKYLIENNIYESRNKALNAIKDGLVLVNGEVITKPAFEVNPTDDVKSNGNSCPYVSRGGLKLEGAIKTFNLDFKDKVILDIGSSTGGFTDCALKFGARLVYAVDVGTNQLHETLKTNPKVISYENTNIIDLDLTKLEKIDYIVMDVSFVSIEYLLDSLDKIVDSANSLVCLIKPQFEIGKKKLKGGIVKDRSDHLLVLNQVSNALEEKGLYINKCAKSPILGGSGNLEFISLIKREKPKSKVNFLSIV